ncbi:MAG: hypothetical protein ACRD1B_11885 [Thermoanaerobaculia bacterium]
MKKTGRLTPKFKRELAEATAPYDVEMAVERFSPLSAEAKARWNRARRKPGRPRRGKGARVISVSVEMGLLERSDALARRLGVSRASLIERGLKAVLVSKGKA